MKIFDCFMYFDEEMILDLRLNILNGHVDYFIIVESRYNHKGERRKLLFNKEKFIKYRDKIIYLVHDEVPSKVKRINDEDDEKTQTNKYIMNALYRENAQRNYIINGLSSAGEDDYVIISDVDEIPDLTKINILGNFKFSVFEQKMYYYKINLLNKTNPFWYGSRVCKKKYLKSPQWLRHQYSKKIKFWQIHRYFTNPPIIENGGWHFSFIGTPETVKNKIEDYAHGEINTKKNKDLNRIRQKIKDNEDVIDDVILQKVKLDSTFPKYILKNQDKLKNFIIK